MPLTRLPSLLLTLTCLAILAAALSVAQSVVAPVVFAVFVIALVWPLQGRLQRSMPAAAATVLTLLVALVTLIGLALMVAWAFGRVGASVVANAAQLQAFYAAQVAWAESRGIEVAGVLAAQFDARWLVRVAQTVLSQLQGMLSFILLTLVFVLLGLLEVDAARAQMLRLGPGTAAALLRAAERTAAKLRAYMMVRTLMSVLTGLVVWAFAAAIGLELAAEWGAIALVLNYIPFLGPLIATLFPTLFAALQFGSWGTALLVFAGLQVVQFLGGSYIEPRLTGKSLAVSPFLVLVSVFAGGFIWGIPGALIGTPVLIAALTLCEEFPTSRPYAELLSGQEPRTEGEREG
ncbi:AI-2E family transporter [Falsiroseomonas oryziterrae]|uniref:AI-2E family transporter n=1 Tax=Falsiroseomonas oryziterrae TaxID=2911368 RepID=UPI001F38D9A8|nr:AI-2E family transporter [Roseomonas sp. NPKOSM-4]